MPELPEVETVRKYLEATILDQKISSVFLSNKKSLRNVSASELNSIKEEKIISLDRVAKHLIIKLQKHYLILHLRMEGKLFFFKTEKEMNEHTNRFHDVLILKTNKGIILFQDTRRFATIDLFKNDVAYENNSVLVKVGPEPFKLSEKDLFEKLQRKNVAIKSALLDQSIISGLGNIYVDEVLHASMIRPETRSNKLTLEQCKLVIINSRLILKKAIKHNGTTIRSYTSSLGVQGTYQELLRVHQQTECGTCGRKVEKIKVGGRGTYFCPKCQK